MITVNNPYFHLDNGKISFILQIMENGQPCQLYYGASLGKLESEDYEFMSRRFQKSAGTVKYAAGSSFSLADQTSELPVYGTTLYQSPAISLLDQQRQPVYSDFKVSGYEIQSGSKTIVKGPHCRLDDHAETLILKLTDETAKMEVRMFYSITEDRTMIIRHNEVINRSDSEVLLDALASGVLYLPDENWELIHLSGNWARERQIISQNLNTGGFFTESLSGASSHQENPFAAFVRSGAAENEGEAYGSNLVYSSNFLNQIKINEFGFLRFMSGIHPMTFSWKLEPGDSFSSPQAVFAWSDQGLDGLSREYSRFVRDFIINPRFANKARPVCLNSWEAVYFGLNENNLYEIAKQGAKAGIECFVMDDGWFGHRDQADSSLSDWFEDNRKFPSGLKEFARKIRELGMGFGIWFEPEMISEDSELYRSHPEYVLRPKQGRYSIGRNQIVLDFANPEVVGAIYQQMKKVLLDTEAVYIKWDMNRSITEAYSNWIAENGREQNEFFHRYIHGVYDLYEKIQRDFPEILIEGCAGGGGRFDLGILYYSPQIWVSDNTDGADRLRIQYGTSLAYPISAMSNHISEIPNHQTHRKIGMDFRKDVAFFGILGYELDPGKLSDKELEEIRIQIEQYKKIQPLILNGDFYHLRNPFTKNTSAVAAADEDRILIGCYSIQSDLSGRTFDRLRLPFANGKAWKLNDEEISSKILSRFGYRFPVLNNGTGALNGNQQGVLQQIFTGDYQSSLNLLKKV